MGEQAAGASDGALADLVALLVAAGCEPEGRAAPDWTSPLGQAVVGGRCEVARALARAGASLDTTVSERGRTLEEAAHFYLAHDPGARANMMEALDDLRGRATSQNAARNMLGALAELRGRATSQNT